MENSELPSYLAHMESTIKEAWTRTYGLPAQLSVVALAGFRLVFDFAGQRIIVDDGAQQCTITHWAPSPNNPAISIEVASATLRGDAISYATALVSQFMGVE